MNESHAQWALTLPVCLSMLASLAFLINVMRVLLTKLHCNSANPAPIGLRKALRAALILVPLFGIHLILIPFRPEPHEPGEKIYQVFSALLVSLQVSKWRHFYSKIICTNKTFLRESCIFYENIVILLNNNVFNILCNVFTLNNYMRDRPMNIYC